VTKLLNHLIACYIHIVNGASNDVATVRAPCYIFGNLHVPCHFLLVSVLPHPVATSSSPRYLSGAVSSKGKQTGFTYSETQAPNYT
jgi:hypothetical protein